MTKLNVYDMPHVDNSVLEAIERVANIDNRKLLVCFMNTRVDVRFLLDKHKEAHQIDAHVYKYKNVTIRC